MSSSRGFNFSLTRQCGTSFENGDIRFTPKPLASISRTQDVPDAPARSTALFTSVGNRLSRVDLENHTSETYAFETRSSLRRIALQPAPGTLVVCVDDDGAAVLANVRTGAVVHRVNFKSSVAAMEFNPTGDLLAVSFGRKTQVWKLPNGDAGKTWSPMELIRTSTGHSDDVTSLQWFPEGCKEGFVTGSRDGSVHTHYVKREAIPSSKNENDDEEDEEEEDAEPESFASAHLLGHKSAVVGAFPVSEDVLYSVSHDGSLLHWEATMDSLGKRDWHVVKRHYVQLSHARVTAAAATAGFLLLGFDDGVFSLLELPSGQALQSLSASKFAVDSVSIDAASGGAWLALGSSTTGQLCVWEWQSETFVLKQQGHYFDLNAVAHSADGRFVASGGDDAKIKVWSAATGVCFVTFTEHISAITGLSFIPNDAIVSSSLDGTVRAFDLVRMRNFSTLTPPEACQLTCLAVDGGDVVAAGALEPPNIFVWSLRTGTLMDVLSGHEGPIASLDFAPGKFVLASASWDKTIKLWEPYKSVTPTDSLSTSSDALCVTFRPDGKELASTGVDGKIEIWDLETTRLKGSIEARRDAAANSAEAFAEGGVERDACFTTLCYSADGKCVLAAGKSRWLCVYDVRRELLVKKFQLTHDDSASAAKTWRAGDRPEEDEEGEDARRKRWRQSSLPGASRGKDAGKRSTRPRMKVACVRFSPTGRSWVAATSQGLLIYSLSAETSSFEPIEMDERTTPNAVRRLARSGDYAQAARFALYLGEEALVRSVVLSVPRASIPLVARAIPSVFLPKLLTTLADLLESSPQVERLLVWAFLLMTTRAKDFSRASAADLRAAPAMRSLQRAVGAHEKKLRKLCDENTYDAEHLCLA